jgi:hypothetical protein
MSSALASIIGVFGKSDSPEAESKLKEAQRLVDEAEEANAKAQWETLCDTAVAACKEEISNSEATRDAWHILLEERAQLQLTVQTCSERHDAFSLRIADANTKLNEALLTSTVGEDRLLEMTGDVDSLSKLLALAVDIARTAETRIADIDAQVTSDDYEGVVARIAELSTLVKNRQKCGEMYSQVIGAYEKQVDAGKQHRWSAQNRAADIASLMTLPTPPVEQEQLDALRRASEVRTDNLARAQAAHAAYRAGFSRGAA